MMPLLKASHIVTELALGNVCDKDEMPDEHSRQMEAIGVVEIAMREVARRMAKAAEEEPPEFRRKFNFWAMITVVTVAFLYFVYQSMENMEIIAK